MLRQVEKQHQFWFCFCGFNITILAALFTTIFFRLLGRWRGALAALAGIAAYTLLVGADAAVVRAALMGGLALFARQVGRRQEGLNSLAFVAMLMALFNPNVLWDVGFQLSFAATLGLVLFATPLVQAFARFASRRLPQASAERLAWPFVLYTTRVVELLAGLPGGVFDLGKVALPLVALFYALLLWWTFGREQFQRAAFRLIPGLGLLLPALAAALVWRAVFAAPDGRLHLIVLDVGGGEALLVRTPSGRNLLINGGPSATRLSDALGRRLPLTRRELDYLVVAGGSDEQLQALPRLVERFRPANVLWAGPAHVSRSARALYTGLSDSGVAIVEAVPGQALDLGQGAVLRVLSVGARGAILELEWGSFRALLPTGADFAAMEALGNGKAIGPVTALLLAGGGYTPLNPPEWIAQLRPQVALLSVAAADWRGLPDPETLQAVAGYTLLRTDRNGWIHLSTDGEQLWVEVERK